MEKQANLNAAVGRHYGADGLVRLLDRYGEVMRLRDIAVEASSTANALRLRILRRRSMPPEAPLHLRDGRAHKYMTRDVALWLFGEPQPEHDTGRELVGRRAEQQIAKKRGRGRPKGSTAARRAAP